MSPDEEENAVRQLGNEIGYTRLLEHAYRLRDRKPVDLSVGYCVHGVGLAYRCRSCESEQALQQTPGA